MKSYTRVLGGLATLAAVGLTGNAHAQNAEDVNAVLNNIEPAGVALTEGLANTVTTLVETQSAVETSDALGQALVDGGAALVEGAPTLGTLGSLGFGIINNSVQMPVQGVLAVVDDPSAQTLEGVFNPEDLTTIGNNLENVPGESLPFGRDALIALLDGDSQTAFDRSLSMLIGVDAALVGTNYESLGSPSGNVPVLAPVVALGLVGLVGGAPVFEPADEALAPIAAELGPYVNESQLGLPPLVGSLESIPF